MGEFRGLDGRFDFGYDGVSETMSGRNCFSATFLRGVVLVFLCVGGLPSTRGQRLLGLDGESAVCFSAVESRGDDGVL
jgi:hypothetical protein